MATSSRLSKERRGPVGTEAGTDTRDRVLDAALALIAERGNAAITLVDVAARAGLSRQTLYLLFGNRAGLLLGAVDRIDARSAAPRQMATIRESLAPRDAFEPYLRAWLAYLQQIYPIAKALSAAAAMGDEEARLAWESRMGKLRGGFLHLTRGLRREGALHEGWTPAAAADWLYAVSHVDQWHHLVVESGWPPGQAVERIVRALREDLISDAGATSASGRGRSGDGR